MTIPPEMTILSPAAKIDPSQHIVWRGATPIYLPVRTWTILDYLVHHLGQLVASDVLLQIGWPDEPGHTQADLYRHIRRIRQAIEPDSHHPKFLLTRRDFGYELLRSTNDGSR